MLNEIFGLLTVLDLDRTNSNYQKYWRCRCECGLEKVIRGDSLKSGRTRSCGCATDKWVHEQKFTHGYSDHELYGTWWAMLDRCYNSDHQAYRRYGERGIMVCDEWHDIAAYIADIESHLGPRPCGLTLDRVDNDQGYFISNMRWATRKQQAQNRKQRNS